MQVDAIILTGGRSSRLDSVPKAEFIVDKSTLLERTLCAASGAHRIVVVGYEPSRALPRGVMLVREEPPFSGPVAAIAAGIGVLERSTVEAGIPSSDALLVLACDMPHVDHAVPQLLRALADAPDADGTIAVDTEGHRQPLAAVYRKRALVAALSAVSDPTRQGDPLAGLPMFRLLDHLMLVEFHVPPGATADVDTWDDAVRLGATPPETMLSTALPATLPLTKPPTEGLRHE